MAEFKVSITTSFPCDLERAFKSPMLCDIRKVHTGFLVMPKVTHCEDDSDWGKPKGSRRVFMAKTFLFKGGEALLDTVLERKENQYWKIKVDHVRVQTFGIHTFIGEWSTTSVEKNNTKVTYSYTLQGSGGITYPLQWMVAKVMWPIYMRRVLNNIKQLAIEESPYLFD
jgi:hypothetical protein